jgi:hypothetical protein
MSSQASTKLIWANRFQSIPPSASQLRDGYPKPLHAVFDAARELFLEIEGVSERVDWHGVPWRWTLVYNAGEDSMLRSLQSPATRAFAYIIPDPAKLQVCIPLTREQIAVMPMRRFKKGVRDTIVFARTVAGISWPTWEIPSKAALDDLAELVDRKSRFAIGPDAAGLVQASA